MGHSTWILQKKDTNVAAYYIHSTDVIPPRFSWNTGNAQAPGMCCNMCMRVSSYYPSYYRCSMNHVNIILESVLLCTVCLLCITKKSNTTVKLIAIFYYSSALLQWQITQLVHFDICASISNISTIIWSWKHCNHFTLMALCISLHMIIHFFHLLPSPIHALEPSVSRNYREETVLKHQLHKPD